LVLAAFVFRIGSRLSSFLVIILLARYLDPESVGIYATVAASIYLSSYVFELGIRGGCARAFSRPQEGALKSSAFYAALLGSISAAIVCAYVFKAVFDIESSYTIIFGSLTAAAATFSHCAQGVFIGEADLRRANIFETAPKLLSLLFTAAACGLDLIDVETSVFALFLSFLFSSIGAGYHAFIKGSPLSKPSARDALSLANLGFLICLSSAVVALGSGANVYAAKIVLGAAAAGIFYTAYKLSDVIAEAATAASMVLFSKSTRAADDRAAVLEGLKGGLALFGCGVIAAAILIALSDIIISIAFGPDFLEASSVLRVIALSLPFLCFSRVMQGVFGARGRGGMTLRVQSASLAINILLCLLLVSVYGLAGIAWALVISRIFSMAMYLTRSISFLYWRPAG